MVPLPLYNKLYYLYHVYNKLYTHIHTHIYMYKKDFHFIIKK